MPDSFYEYMLKCHILLGDAEYLHMFKKVACPRSLLPCPSDAPAPPTCASSLILHLFDTAQVSAPPHASDAASDVRLIFPSTFRLSLPAQAYAAAQKHLRRDPWYVEVNMDSGLLVWPTFNSLQAFWPGLQARPDTIESIVIRPSLDLSST